MDAEAKRLMFEEARRKGQEIEDRGLYAIEAHIEEAANGEDLIFIRYANGSEYRIPARMVQDVHDLSREQLHHMVLGEPGTVLFWEEEGRDAYIPNLIQGYYGNKAWMNSQAARFKPQAPEPTPA